MATNTIFYDNESELKCYVNHENLLYIEIVDKEQHEYYFGCIVLDLNDGKELVKLLNKCLRQIDRGKI